MALPGGHKHIGLYVQEKLCAHKAVALCGSFKRDRSSVIKKWIMSVSMPSDKVPNKKRG
jgi:hypothetical protein